MRAAVCVDSACLVREPGLKLYLVDVVPLDRHSIHSIYALTALCRAVSYLGAVAMGACKPSEILSTSWELPWPQQLTDIAF